ncbi:hypothetical protein PIB30_013338 [Stylosanthes scabra]|uniref:MBD domain-containing protein n=1 Tax=Stylosanthes scabra TaxID=79078 RepID=A0ABU6U5B6_9FABA|nr:hypothetical protein [Stylosanthes scabra]
MDFGSDDKGHDDMNVNYSKVSSASLYRELGEQVGMKIFELMFGKVASYEAGAIPAIPLSCYFPAQPSNNVSSPKHNNHNHNNNNKNDIKKSSASSPSPASTSSNNIKKSTQFEEQYGANWKCVPRQRKNGKWDKFYYHNESGMMCRSLKEIEKFEKEGIRPGRIPKKAKIENVETKVREMDVTMTEKTSMAKKEEEKEELQRKGDEVEKFMADAQQNLNQFHLNNQQYFSDDSERTPSPPWSLSHVVSSR